MTPADAAKILAIAAAYDRRTVGQTDAIAWADALDGLDPRDCAEAVRAHYRDSRQFAMPADVRTLVNTRRRELARRRHDTRVLGELEAAKTTAETEADRVATARAEARAAFTAAIEAKHAREAETEAQEVDA